ncbi:transcriptional repressor [Streptosporangium sp. NPDC002607]
MVQLPATAAHAYQRLDPRIEWRGRLANHGLRATRARVAVLEGLAEVRVADVTQVRSHLQGAAPGLSKQSIYTILHDLETCGLVFRVPVSGPRRHALDADRSAYLRSECGQPRDGSLRHASRQFNNTHEEK